MITYFMSLFVVSMIEWPQLRLQNCLKLNSDKFEVFCDLLTGGGILRQKKKKKN